MRNRLRIFAHCDIVVGVYILGTPFSFVPVGPLSLCCCGVLASSVAQDVLGALTHEDLVEVLDRDAPMNSFFVAHIVLGRLC